MAEVTLPPFPVDDVTLDALEHAIGGAYTVDEDGKHTLVGADMTVSQLLDFLSGYDPAKSKQMVNEYDTPDPDCFEYPDPIYHPHDVIRALIAEVRDLRGSVNDVLALCDEWDDGVSPECSAMADKLRAALGQERAE